ncbi:hypothetical protein ACVWW6_006613 [Bradyrhizobium sp. USDA 3311]
MQTADVPIVATWGSKQKTRKQPHAQYKSMRNFLPRGLAPCPRGRLTRRARQAQDCTIPKAEFAAEPNH